MKEINILKGIHTVIRSSKVIGDNVKIGANAVVTKNHNGERICYSYK